MLCSPWECTRHELWATHLLQRRNSHSQRADISWRCWVRLHRSLFVLDGLLENQRNKFSYFVQISLQCTPNYCSFHQLEVIVRLFLQHTTMIHPHLPPCLYLDPKYYFHNVTTPSFFLDLKWLANILCKDPDSKYFRFCGTYIFCCNYCTQFCHYRLRTARENNCMNKHGCSNKTLFMKISSGWGLVCGLYFANPGLQYELVRRFQVNWETKPVSFHVHLLEGKNN